VRISCGTTVTKRLYSKLRQLYHAPTELQRVGRVFIDFVCNPHALASDCLKQHTLTPWSAQMEEFNKYNVYNANKVSSTETYNKLIKRSSAFQQLCDVVKGLPESKQQDLESFLMKPFQRITRYPLLLEVRTRASPAIALVHDSKASRHDRCCQQSISCMVNFV